MAALARLFIADDSTSLPEPAAATPLSPLLRTAADFVTLKADHAEANARAEIASSAAKALHPAPPMGIHDRAGHSICRGELRYLDEATARLRGVSSHRLAELTLWQAQVDAIDSSFGVPGLEEAAERAAEAEDRAANRVAAMRAGSVHEAAVKYAVLLASWADRERDEVSSARVFFDFLTDLEGLAHNPA
ncbi:MAG: hypothetical protein Q8S03_18035 [Brevundimonas sp.]|uniref:hypothetical protein n=1 Tax=Brevundimonas sp. TaxID=1871086 RepID=UPI00273409B8|nr:hypothetical protein [Brevundimonas sp.]MDP3406594.1 hypothetical protein [Brevundimonas sp.]